MCEAGAVLCSWKIWRQYCQAPAAVCSFKVEDASRPGSPTNTGSGTKSLKGNNTDSCKLLAAMFPTVHFGTFDEFWFWWIRIILSIQVSRITCQLHLLFQIRGCKYCRLGDFTADSFKMAQTSEWRHSGSICHLVSGLCIRCRYSQIWISKAARGSLSSDVARWCYYYTLKLKYQISGG